MADRDLKLRVVFAALDKITGPLKKITGQSGATARALKATSDRLKELNSQQKSISSFRELHQGLETTSAKLQQAQQRVAGLARKIRETETPTRAMTREFNAAVKSAGALKATGQQQSQQLQLLRDRLHGAGISTSNLSQHERSLRTEIAATNAQLAEQQKRLGAVASRNQRIAGARQHAEKARTAAGNLAGAGVGATTAGVAIGMPLFKAIGEAKHYQLEMTRVKALGLGEHISDDAIQFASAMKTYGTSTVENLGLMRDALTVFADEHHARMVTPTLAKMKFANAAVFGEEAGAENERKFMDMLKVIEMRGGLASEQAFIRQADMVQKVISATGGRVGPSEWLNFIKTGGIAAKIMDDKSFYYQMEPLVQEVGGHRAGTALMSGYSNLYQGRTTKRAVQNMEKLGLIGDTSKVKHDKVGQISTLGPGALLGSDVFRRSQFEWMEKILLPQLAKKGITDAKQIEDTIGGLFSTRTAGNQFLDFYRQRAQIHKNAKLNAGAYDIEQINTLGKQQASGKEIEAEAKLADLKLALGEKILPLYVQGLELATSAAQKLTTFMQEHPTLAKAIAVSFGVLAAILLVLGPLMLAMAALIGPYAMLHILFAKMGIAGGVLTPILRGVGSAFVAVGAAVKTVGMFLFTTPIGLIILAIVAAIALLAGAVYLIRKNWEPIMKWLSEALESFKSAAGTAWQWIKDKAVATGQGIVDFYMNWTLLGVIIKNWDSITGFMSGKVIEFTTIGGQMMDGFTTGFLNKFYLLKDAIYSAGEKAVGWFKDKLGIHSPSRVFADLGDFTMQGLALGLQRSEDAPLSQVSDMARRLTQLGAGIAIGAAAMPAAAFDTRPPVAARGTAASVDSHDTIQITITPAPGMDPQAIARAVAAELDRRDRQKAARIRSSLHDY